MLTIKVRLAALGAVLLLGFGPIVTGPATAQADLEIGTWELNVAKSNYSPGPPPKSLTATYERAGQGVKVTTKGVDASGKPTATAYTANYDGKDYPVTGNPAWDAVALTRVDAHTVEVTRKKSGKVVQTGKYVMSKDGKTRTITVTGVDEQGRKINNVSVFEKK